MQLFDAEGTSDAFVVDLLFLEQMRKFHISVEHQDLFFAGVFEVALMQ